MSSWAQLVGWTSKPRASDIAGDIGGIQRILIPVHPPQSDIISSLRPREAFPSCGAPDDTKQRAGHLTAVNIAE